MKREGAFSAVSGAAKCPGSFNDLCIPTQESMAEWFCPHFDLQYPPVRGSPPCAPASAHLHQGAHRKAGSHELPVVPPVTFIGFQNFQVAWPEFQSNRKQEVWVVRPCPPPLGSSVTGLDKGYLHGSMGYCVHEGRALLELDHGHGGLQ